MFEKIDYHLGPELLEIGNTVIYYPDAEGDFGAIDLSDSERFELYIVAGIEHEEVLLGLIDDDTVPTESQEYVTGPAIVKTFRELIEEGQWWARFFSS